MISLLHILVTDQRIFYIISVSCMIAIIASIFLLIVVISRIKNKINSITIPIVSMSIFTIISIILATCITHGYYERMQLAKQQHYIMGTVKHIDHIRKEHDQYVYSIKIWESDKQFKVVTKDKLHRGDYVQYKKVGDFIMFDRHVKHKTNNKEITINDLNDIKHKKFNYVDHSGKRIILEAKSIDRHKTLHADITHYFIKSHNRHLNQQTLKFDETQYDKFKNEFSMYHLKGQQFTIKLINQEGE